MMQKSCWILWMLACAAGVMVAGCGRDHYQRSADKEVYGIIKQRQADVLSKTNGNFSVDTAYSTRKPKDIPAAEILQDRAAAVKQKLSLRDALTTAYAKSREYQYRKETTYLTALTLTSQRYAYAPHFFATSKVSFTRQSDGSLNRDVYSTLGATEALKSGGQLAVSVVNDMLSYYTGGGGDQHTSLFVASLTQPLLRGAGQAIVTENLTQAERNVIYDIRDFVHFEQDFAVQIVKSYITLLQQQNTVRNDYNNYRMLIQAKERAEALGVDRLPGYQVDQARQDMLTSKSRYLSDMKNYQAAIDDFKIKLGLPLGVEIELDHVEFDDLTKIGVAPLSLGDKQAYEIALVHRLDIQNSIDQFEDSKRKIEVAANRLLPDLNLFGSVKAGSRAPNDYAHFDVKDYQAVGGVELKLPLDRLNERNDFRSALISFERQLRTLAVTLDNLRDSVRTDLRNLETARRNFDIQTSAVTLANRRVEGATLLLQAGRAQMRDLLDAQSSALTAGNAWGQALLDYNVALWTLQVDLGVLRTGIDKFWVKPVPVLQTAAGPQGRNDDVVPPEELFR